MESKNMRKKKIQELRKYVVFSLMFFLIGVVALLVTQLQTRQEISSHAATGDCTVSTAQMQIKTQEQALFDAINAYRVSKGLAKLTWSNDLKKPAAWLSADMYKSKNLSHTDSLGRSPETRLPNCGYYGHTFGENIALGPANPTETLNAWENSPPHNTIMLDPAYTYGAVAMESDSAGEISYWTLDVGVANMTVTATPTPSGTITPTVTPSGTITPPVTGTVTPTITAGTGTPTVTVDPSGELPTPTTGPLTADMQILAQVKIEGIGKGGNIYPKRQTRKVRALVFATDGTTVVANGTGFLVYDKEDLFTGVIHLGKLTQGIYFVKLSSDYTLQSMVKPEFQLLKINTVNSLPPVSLFQGDITGDNILALDDYNKALACFQMRVCDQADELDFNDDGITNITDYNILLHSFGQSRGN